MARKPKAKRRSRGALVMMGFSLLLGAACGLLTAALLPEGAFDGSLARTYALCVPLFAWLLLSYHLQIIAHEAGHLLFGLLTGYRFASFRIGSLLWIDRGGRIRLCRYRLAGTAGQCLMKPPEVAVDELPVMLYNLGGVIVNAAAGAMLLAAGLCAGGLARALLLIPAFVGLAVALMNGIPLRGAVANDGANALSLRRDAAARRAFWIQLRQVELLGDGVRLRDVPEAEAWFVMPGDNELNSPLVAELAAFRCNYLLDAHRFEEAARTIDRLLDADSALAEVNRRLLVCDRATCGALLGEETEKLSAMLDEKPQRKLMRAMRDYPSVLRTQYARALLKNDLAEADQLVNRFEAVAARYPYPGEIEGERELMALLREHRAAQAEPGACSN